MSNINELFSIISRTTGLSKDELIDAAIDPAKQPEAFRKIRENAKREMRGEE